MKVDSDGVEPRAAEGRAPAWPPGAGPEDNYEAALRAADALFSGGRAADASSTDAISAEAQQPGSRRVLRVLDEPPSPEMARLEAEYAPKKRGRKPGSKNKPKSPALSEVTPTSASPPPANEAREAPAMAAVEPAGITQSAMMQPTVTHPRTNVVPVAALAASVGPGTPRGERYAWVRTRLKPGEHWKRRLPKVAW